MRLIDADKLLYCLSGWDWQDVYLPIHFKELVDEQPTVNQWIPCYKSLPRLYKDVIICLENGDVTSGARFKELWIEGEDISYEYGEVIAWMPLPKPYSE